MVYQATMACPVCGGKAMVLDARKSGGGIHRRRECTRCKHRWSTKEGPTEDPSVFYAIKDMTTAVGALAKRARHLEAEALTLSEKADALNKKLDSITETLEPPAVTKHTLAKGLS